MELGLSTSVLGMAALPDGLAAFAGHGVSWVEIHGYEREEFDFSDHALVAATKQALVRHGLRLWAVHSPAYAPLDLASSDAGVRLRTCAAMREAMGVAVELGARVFVCDGARPHSDDTPAEADARRRLYAESLRPLFDEGCGSGLRFVIENTPRGAARFVVPDDFRRLETEYGLAGLGVCWDTGHGWIAGQTPEVACRFGDRLVTIHAHDNDGQRDRHWLPTTGGITWEPFVRCLRRIGYSGPFMMELGPPAPGTPDAVRRVIEDAVTTYDRLIG